MTPIPKPPAEIAREIAQRLDSIGSENVANSSAALHVITQAITADRERAANLLERAEKWLEHADDCGKFLVEHPYCSCGLTQLRAEIKAALGKGETV